jgi:hypothetical protein
MRGDLVSQLVQSFPCLGKLGGFRTGSVIGMCLINALEITRIELNLY